MARGSERGAALGSADRSPGRRRLRRRPRRGRVVRRRGLRLIARLTSFSGRVHRQTGLDTPAFPPDRPAPTEARYHRRGDPWPLYASLEPETAWAEWSAATRGGVDPTGERRRLWRLEVDGLRVLDLRRPALQRELGVTLADLTGPRAHAQDLAARAQALGAEGMIVPSSARDGHWNLVAFPTAFTKVRVQGSTAARPRPPSPRAAQ